MIINIVAIRVVKNFALEGILISRGNIITGHENNLLRVHTLLDQDLVGVECVSLVSIVIVSTAAGNDDGPVIACLHGCGKLSCHHSTAER